MNKIVIYSYQNILTTAIHTYMGDLLTTFYEKNRTQKDIYSSISFTEILKSGKIKLLCRTNYVGYKTILKNAKKLLFQRSCKCRKLSSIKTIDSVCMVFVDYVHTHVVYFAGTPCCLTQWSQGSLAQEKKY